MDLKTESAVLELKPGQVIALDDAQGASVRARCGSVWITEEGEKRDFILGAGERRRLGGRRASERASGERGNGGTTPPHA